MCVGDKPVCVCVCRSESFWIEQASMGCFLGCERFASLEARVASLEEQNSYYLSRLHDINSHLRAIHGGHGDAIVALKRELRAIRLDVHMPEDA